MDSISQYLRFPILAAISRWWRDEGLVYFQKSLPSLVLVSCGSKKKIVAKPRHVADQLPWQARVRLQKASTCSS